MNIKKYDAIGETLYSETLPNGLRILVAPKAGFSKSYAMFATRYGGADRRFSLGGRQIDTPAGVAHFLEHKMFDTPDGGNSLAILSANGASPNAFTSSGYTAYHFESTAGFYENLRTLLTFVSVPYFTAESVGKEQGIIGQEIRMTEDDPSYCVYNNLMRNLYAHNPIRDSVAGTIDSIAQITDKTLYDCHKVFYIPSNMVLGVTGDVDPGRVAALAREILPGEPGEVPLRDYGPEEKAVPERAGFSAAMAVSAPQFLFGCKIDPAENGLTLMRQKMTGDIALRCFLGPSSPFYLKMYAEGLLSTDFSYELDYSAGVCTLLAGGESRNPDAVMDALRQEISRVRQSGLDPQLFGRVSKAAYGSRLRLLDSPEVLCMELVFDEFSGYCALDEFEASAAITVGETSSFISENLAPDRLSLSVITPMQ